MNEPRFVDPLRVEVTVPGASDGPLAGTTVAVKDVIDVAGVPTGAGNPDWLAQATVPREHAPAVTRLLQAGATVVGKAITEEFAFSMRGVNMHYGIPRNPAAPGRVPGGSSSGSASAVALGVADLGLGTDTGGSVRVPASYCGIYGLRTSHGRVPMEGILPLAPTFDTCGVCARDGDLLRRAGLALLGVGGRPLPPPSALVIAGDLVDLANVDAAVSVRSAAAALAERLGCPISEAEVGDGALARLADGFRERQMREAWAVHGPFLAARRPRVAPDVAERFALAKRSSERMIPGDNSTSSEGLEYGPGRRLAMEIIAALPVGAALVLPSAPTGAAEPFEQPAAAARTRARLLSLTSLAGLAGAPQVSLPLCGAEGLPLGLGLLARPGEDEMLLAAAARCD